MDIMGAMVIDQVNRESESVSNFDEEQPWFQKQQVKAEPPVDMMRTHRPASAGLADLIFSIKVSRQEMAEVRAHCRMPTDNMAVDQGLLVLHPIKRPIPSLTRLYDINDRGAV